MSTEHKQTVSTDSDRFGVRIGEKVYSPQFQIQPEYAAGWKSVLKTNYRTSFAVCLCPGQGEKRLKICRIDASDLFYLSKYPNTGEEHSTGCMFYAPAPDKSGLQGYEIGVVEHLSDGDKRVRLQLGLRQTSSERSDSPSVYDVPSRASVSRNSMSLLGLLHLLWTEAGLNRWHPAMLGKRSVSRIGYWLLEQGRQIRASRMVLSDVMLVHAKSGHQEAQRNQTVSANARTRGLRLIAVDALAKFNADKYSMPLSRLPMSGPAGLPFSSISETLWERTEKRFARELNVWKSGAAPVIAIAQIEVKGERKNAGRVTDLALMVVSSEWIPLDSRYEAAVENQLREQRRSFFKPLRYDAGKECVFPDFWLLDVERDFPMEVFGMATPEYVARRAEKANYYDKKYGCSGWWFWDATRSPNIPDFPLPVPFRATRTQ